MSIIGKIGNKIGEITSEAQEKAAAKKAAAAENLENAQASTRTAVSDIQESASSIFTVDQDEVGTSIFEAVGGDVMETANAYGEYDLANAEEEYALYQEMFTNVASDIQATAETVGGAATTLVGTAGAALDGIVSGIAEDAAEGANAYLDEES